MGGNKIGIQTQKLRDSAQYIRDKNLRLEDTLNSVSNKVKQLETTWQSDAGNEIRNKITKFATNNFNQYKQVVEDYAKYLVSTAEMYETNEAKTVSNASAFKEK
jgi:WXG100 family type VII secretion target